MTARSACLLLAALFVSGCGSAERISAPRQSDYELGELAGPEFIELSEDGGVWVTDSFSNTITRIDPETGAAEKHELPDEDYPGDIVKGPDGALWFPTTGPLGRIDGNGSVTHREIEGLPSITPAIAAGEDELWVATAEDAYPLIARVEVDGSATVVAKLPDEPFDVEGMAEGADGALWLTESSYGEGDPPDGIARVTPDGSYSRWPLSDPKSTPVRITAGPDEALWFTEQLGHGIGRITTKGEITEFPLGELSPYDITTGRDGALWFTTDTCLGRITTKGEVATWLVAGARELVGIAAAPDGSFWLADRVGGAVRHFTPPKPAKSSEPACEPPSVDVEAGTTHAKVVYKRLDTMSDGDDFFTDIRLRISRKGEHVFKETIPKYPFGRPYQIFGYASSVDALDLDADGEPEVILELNWNGTHCCFWWRVYRFDAERDTYVPATHFWGNAAAMPKLRDLDGDGRREIVSKDDRFSELTGYAGAFRPIQVWSYENGRFTEVTRSHPNAIRQDAAELWDTYLENRGKYPSRYVLAAWAADQYMLGRGTTAEGALQQALERGDLDAEEGDLEDAADYLTRIRAFLRKTGYIRD